MYEIPQLDVNKLGHLIHKLEELKGSGVSGGSVQSDSEFVIKLDKFLGSLSEDELDVSNAQDGALDVIDDEQKIEKIILENTKKGERFYPHEIAFGFNLDLRITMKVMEKLLARGAIRE